MNRYRLNFRDMEGIEDIRVEYPALIDMYLGLKSNITVDGYHLYRLSKFYNDIKGGFIFVSVFGLLSIVYDTQWVKEVYLCYLALFIVGYLLSIIMKKLLLRRTYRKYTGVGYLSSFISKGDIEIDVFGKDGFNVDVTNVGVKIILLSYLKRVVGEGAEFSDFGDLKVTSNGDNIECKFTYGGKSYCVEVLDYDEEMV